MHRIVSHKLTLLGLVLTVAMALGLGLGWAGHPTFQPEPADCLTERLCMGG